MSAYTDAVESGLKGLRGVSTGECPGCERCADMHDMTPDEHAVAYRAGSIDVVHDEFSARRCGICHTGCPGARHAWHWIAGGDQHGHGGTIEHEMDACEDCVRFLANGDVPSNWRR